MKAQSITTSQIKFESGEIHLNVITIFYEKGARRIWTDPKTNKITGSEYYKNHNHLSK